MAKRFMVSGADKITGADREVVVTADTPEQAERSAVMAGIYPAGVFVIHGDSPASIARAMAPLTFIVPGGIRWTHIGAALIVACALAIGIFVGRGGTTNPVLSSASQDQSSNPAYSDRTTPLVTTQSPNVSAESRYTTTTVKNGLLGSSRTVKVISHFPMVGDETSLARVYADPQSYIGKPIILVGVIVVGNYYNYGYAKISDISYSLDFGQRLGDGSRGKGVYVYAGKPMCKLLVDSIVAEEELGIMKAVRIKVVLSEHGMDSQGRWQEQVELIDWSDVTVDNSGWGAWHLGR